MKPLDAAKRILDLTREGWAIDRLSIDWALQQTGDLRCSHINTVAECQPLVNVQTDAHHRREDASNLCGRTCMPLAKLEFSTSHQHF
jgi:hypothetical protein